MFEPAYLDVRFLARTAPVMMFSVERNGSSLELLTALDLKGTLAFKMTSSLLNEKERAKLPEISTELELVLADGPSFFTILIGYPISQKAKPARLTPNPLTRKKPQIPSTHKKQISHARLPIILQNRIHHIRERTIKVLPALKSKLLNK